MHEYLAARTAFFDRIVVGALDGGVRQVVVGGAGYDGRALRYAKPGVRWFEVDHPATQADKRERLDRLGLDAAHVRFVAADFAADPVADLLLAAGLDANAPGLFLLEGVAVYLEPTVVDAILDQFRQVAGAGSRLAISVSLSGEYDRGGRAGFRASVAARGEPARSAFAADEAEAILARAGWLVTPDPDGAGGPRGGRPAPAPALGRPAHGQRGPEDAADHSEPGTPNTPAGPENPNTPADPPPAPERQNPGEPRPAQRGLPLAVGPAVPGPRGVHDRVRQRSRTPDPAPHDELRGVRPRRRRLAGVDGHVGELSPTRKRAAGRSRA